MATPCQFLGGRQTGGSRTNDDDIRVRLHCVSSPVSGLVNSEMLSEALKNLADRSISINVSRPLGGQTLEGRYA
jgi:hypothetical protein